MSEEIQMLVKLAHVEQLMVIIVQVANRQKKKGNHINYLELKEIYLTVKSYRRSWLGKKDIKVKSNNTTAITYINNMGGGVSASEKCNELAKHLQYFCIQQNIWISAIHIPGKDRRTLQQVICPDLSVIIQSSNCHQ